MKIFSIVTLIISLMMATSAMAAKNGSFSGVRSYKASGNVTIEEVGDRYKITLSNNFRFSGAPDAYISFGKGSKPIRHIAKLKKNSGSQSYTIAKSAVGNFSQILIWCKQYSVLMGKASIK